MVQTFYSNIYYLYLIKLSKWLMLIMPIVTLFYADNGLSEFHIYLLQSVYSVSVAVMEIPSGYMADIVGRKKTLILGSCLGTLGFLIYSISYNVEGFIVAEIILGIGGSFISGADSALLYDSLVAEKKEQKYLQFEGRLISVGNFAETAAAICGGLIAAYFSYRAVYACQTLIAALAIPATILLVEPPKESKISQPGFNHILMVCKQSLRYEKRLASTIFFSSITGVATLCMAWTAQIYFVSQGFSEVTITPLWVTLNLTVALSAAYASQVVRFIGNKAALYIVIIFIPSTYIFLGLFPLLFALGSLYFFYAIRGYATPVLKDLIHRNCHSSVRATVLSIRNLIIRFGFALLGPIIGTITATANLQVALISAGAILLLFFFASAYYLIKYNSSVILDK